MDHQMDYPSIQTLLLPILNANCGIIRRYGNLHLILPVIFSSILQKVRSDFNTVCRPAQIGISLIQSTASNLISGTKASVSVSARALNSIAGLFFTLKPTLTLKTQGIPHKSMRV